MRARFHGCGVAIVLAGLVSAGAAGCAPAASTPAAERRTGVPHPDLCKVMDRRDVAAAVHGKITGCEQASTGDGYAVTFSGSTALAGRKHAAAVVIGYTPRYDARGGADRWAAVGQATGNAVPMIGVGEYAIFDSAAVKRPQLVAAAKDVIITVEVRITGAAVPKQRLAEHMMDLGSDAVTALG